MANYMYMYPRITDLFTRENRSSKFRLLRNFVPTSREVAPFNSPAGLIKTEQLNYTTIMVIVVLPG